ncbi:MAG: 3-oxoacyl-ACP reductase [Proteobacteria bacterium]|nr:3-oxoacyl-ACP reductase [Pseudomonadota bacterium]
MSDYLLEISRRPLAKRLVRQLRLPLPLPEPLARASSVWAELELKGHTSAVGGTRDSQLKTVLESIITSAGGEIAPSIMGNPKLNSLVFDASSATTVADLGSLYDFVRPRISLLANNCHVVVIGLAASNKASPEVAGASAALMGFVKSFAKELGRKGGTCQLLLVRKGGDTVQALDTPLKFFLSKRSAFISGQSLSVGATPAFSPAPIVGSLTGKVALVTGAAQGIGAEVARRLAAEGATVIGHDRPQEKANLNALMTEIKGSSLIMDLLDPEAVPKIVSYLKAHVSKVDILVNNAGMTRDKTLARMPRDWWDDTLTINLQAPLKLSQALLAAKGEHDQPLMPAGGRIICMASIAGIAGNAGQTNYATAKAGLIGVVRALAGATAAAGRDITVNALAPGFIETRMTSAMPTALREIARRFNSLNQGGLPVDVAEAAVFLSMPGAGGISGDVLRVCGQNLIGA